jgi:hypothetical protein
MLKALGLEARQILKSIWESPLELDPSRRSAKVTRALESQLAKPAKLLEGKTEPGMVLRT